MKNSYDITTAFREGAHEFAVLSGEKPKEIVGKPLVSQIQKNKKQQLFHFVIKLSKTKFYSFKIIQHKQI